MEIVCADFLDEASLHQKTKNISSLVLEQRADAGCVRHGKRIAMSEASVYGHLAPSHLLAAHPPRPLPPHPPPPPPPLPPPPPPPPPHPPTPPPPPPPFAPPHSPTLHH